MYGKTVDLIGQMPANVGRKMSHDCMMVIVMHRQLTFNLSACHGMLQMDTFHHDTHAVVTLGLSLSVHVLLC